MKNMMCFNLNPSVFWLYFSIWLFLFSSCGEKDNSTTFIFYEKGSVMEKQDSIVIVSSYVYLIRNYRDDIPTLLDIVNFIARHAEKYPPKDVSNTYQISFYKESTKTNLEHLAKQPRDFDRHSLKNDLQYIFIWRSGKFFRLEKYKNGKSVYPPDDGSVILSEPPPLEDE